MIRFIYIGDQITSGAKDFAFYCTVTNAFVADDMEGQVFNSWEDFTEGGVDEERTAQCVSLIPGDTVFATDDEYDAAVDAAIEAEGQPPAPTCPMPNCTNPPEEPHDCPYSYDIEGESVECTCCSACEDACARDI